MATVAGHELVIARGEGVYLWDDQGRRYIDGTASLWHAHIGHGREDMAEAIVAQLRTLEAFQTFGDVANPPALELVDRLVGLSPMTDPRVFLCLGGGDAIDTAAKLARQHWAARGQPERIHLISRTFAYHGTHGFGTSLVGMESMRQGYGPLLGSVSHVDHQSPEALEAEIERVGPANVAAFFCEPVIGAGGVRPAPPGYIEAVAAICKRHGVLLVIDSVICAFGRVGTWLGLRALGHRARHGRARQGHHERVPPARRRAHQRRGRRAILVASPAARCSATEPRMPVTRPAVPPRSRTSTSSSART